jgi:hypothetical protein
LLGGRKRRSAIGAAVAAAAAGVFAISAFAVHDLAFQLDGDVSASTTTSVGGTTQNVDWDSLFDSSGGKKALPAGFTASVFHRDFLTNANGSFNTTDGSTYATGSKDTLAITPGWQCNFDNNVNSKIDVMNAYAAAYTSAGGDQILYFALERNSNAGDGNVGFWFLQDGTVDCNSTSNAPFAGNHQDGDLLVVSAFTNGGSVSTIDVYRWNGGANGSLGTTPVAHGVDCKTTGANDNACATVNGPTNGTGGTITTPWLTSNKQDGPGHSLRTSEFFEGGLNLSRTGLSGHCFNTFIADTRSSQSLTATLFDFARGSLGECTSKTTTTPKKGDGTTDLTTAPVTATGTLDVKDSAKIDVTGASTFSGSVTFFLCRSSQLDAGGACSSGGTQIGSAKAVTSSTTVVSDAAGLTAADKYCWRAEFSGDSAAGVPPSKDGSTGECFTVTPLQPTLTTDATDGPVDFGSKISDTISLTGTANEPGTNGIGPGGTINATNRAPADSLIHFTAFGPDDCTTVAKSGTITVSGDNAAYGGPGSATEFTPGAPGTYTYVASYDGDSPNTLGVNATSCPDPSGTEAVTVRQIPTQISSHQRVYPNDSATITSSAAGDNLPSGGSVVFRLYGPAGGQGALANCLARSDTVGTGGLLYKETNTVGGTHSATSSTSNTSVSVDASDSYFWRVTYAPGDQAHLGRQSDCIENTAVTFTNDSGPGTLFP